MSALCVVSLVGGCASVPLESMETSSRAKRFAPPNEGYAGLYVYRDSFFGKTLKKDLWINGECLGESAADTFFYKQLPGDRKYTITTESEAPPNTLSLVLEQGRNYYVRQYIKIGIFIGGADLEVVAPARARASIDKLDMAKPGSCSQPFKSAALPGPA